jgi:hypothetical protein
MIQLASTASCGDDYGSTIGRVGLGLAGRVSARGDEGAD